MDERIIGRLLALETLMPHMAIKADVNCVRTEIAQAHTSTIKWLIGTLLTGMTVAFAVVRFLAGS